MGTYHVQQQISREFDTLGQMETKIRILIGSKIRNKTRIRKACKTIDNLRQKLANRTVGWDITTEIRKWRDARCLS